MQSVSAIDYDWTNSEQDHFEYDIRSLILAFMLGEKIELTDHVDSIYDFILDVDLKIRKSS